MRAFNGEVHYGTIAAGPAAAEPGGTDTPLVGVGPNAYVAKGASARPNSIMSSFSREPIHWNFAKSNWTSFCPESWLK